MTGSALRDRVQDASHGAGQIRPVNSGKLFGSLPFDGQDLETLFKSGASLVPNGSDHMFLKNSSQNLIKKILDM